MRKENLPYIPSKKCRIMFALIYFDMGTCFYYMYVWAKNEKFHNLIYKIHGKFWGDNKVWFKKKVFLFYLFENLFEIFEISACATRKSQLRLQVDKWLK